MEDQKDIKGPESSSVSAEKPGFIDDLFRENPKIKKFLGVAFMILGVLVLPAPFVNHGLFYFIILEILGVRLLFWSKIKKMIGGLAK